MNHPGAEASATPRATPASDGADVPLAVDLDGTLIRTDLLWESFVAVLRQRPWELLRAPLWWARGRARLKQELGRRAVLDATLLPAHEEFLAWLRQEKQRGRKLLLATASDAAFAAPVAARFGLFDEVLGSDGRQNLRGANKGRVLAERFGQRGFDYAGNSSVDLAVWPFARAAVVVNARPSLPARAAKVATVDRVFPRPRAEWSAVLKALDPAGWFPNLLVLAPLLLLPPGRGVASPGALVMALGAFLAASSAGSLLRALLDLNNDRREAARRHRVFAAGDAPLSRGLTLLAILPALALLLGAFAAPAIGALVGMVLALEVARTVWLRRRLVPEVVAQVWLALARMAAGTLAVGGTLAGSWVAFLALAFAAVGAAERPAAEPERRRWVVAHGCGLLAGPALGWFAGTPAAALAFQRPGWLLLLWPALLLWIMRALKTAGTRPPAADPARWALAVAAGAVAWLAAHG